MRRNSFFALAGEVFTGRVSTILAFAIIGFFAISIGVIARYNLIAEMQNSDYYEVFAGKPQSIRQPRVLGETSTGNLVSPPGTISISTTALAPTLKCGSVITPTNNFCGFYYQDVQYAGSGAQAQHFFYFNFAQIEPFNQSNPALAHDWGTQAPLRAGGVSSGLRNDYFSVRYAGNFYFEPGLYEFWVKSDDGVRLTIDGVNIHNRFYDQSASGEHVQLVYLDKPSTRHLVMEYYEKTGLAQVGLGWTKIVTNLPQTQNPLFQPDLNSDGFIDYQDYLVLEKSWKSPEKMAGCPTSKICDFYSNGILDTQDILGFYNWLISRYDANLDQQITKQDYLDFKTRVAGGTACGLVLCDFTQDGKTDSADTLYLERALSTFPGFDTSVFVCSNPAPNTFCAHYYNDTPYSGNGSTATHFQNWVLSRSENYPISYDWGKASPTTGINTDKFSVIWKGDFTFENGEYEFTLAHDDGLKLYLDGELILNKFFDTGAITSSVKKFLTSGTHSVKVEYYENSGLASINLKWNKISSVSGPAYSVSAVQRFNQNLVGSPAYTNTKEMVVGQYLILWGTFASQSNEVFIGGEKVPAEHVVTAPPTSTGISNQINVYLNKIYGSADANGEYQVFVLNNNRRADGLVAIRYATNSDTKTITNIVTTPYTSPNGNPTYLAGYPIGVSWQATGAISGYTVEIKAFQNNQWVSQGVVVSKTINTSGRALLPANLVAGQQYYVWVCEAVYNECPANQSVTTGISQPFLVSAF